MYYAVPSMLSGFNVTGVEYKVTNINVTFEWDLPQGGGPEVVIDYYLLSVFPRPLSQPITANISRSLLSWEVTVEYTVIYSANITAINCAGGSETAILPTVIEFSRFHLYPASTLLRFISCS